MQKAGAEAKSQWIARDTRKRVTAAVMVTACRIVAPTCEDEAVRHTRVLRGRMAPEHVLLLLHDVAAACDIVGLAMSEYNPWKAIATRKLLRRFPLPGGKCDLTKNGNLQLVAVEYVVLAEGWNANHQTPPVLMGQLFNYVGAPNRYGIPAFYELHVWAWKSDPEGMFADWNGRDS